MDTNELKKDIKEYLDLKIDPITKTMEEMKKDIKDIKNNYVTKEHCKIIQDSKKNFLGLSDKQFTVIVGIISSILGALFGINI